MFGTELVLEDNASVSSHHTIDEDCLGILYCSIRHCRLPSEIPERLAPVCGGLVTSNRVVRGKEKCSLEQQNIS
jgi:hypothetical protein